MKAGCPLLCAAPLLSLVCNTIELATPPCVFSRSYLLRAAGCPAGVWLYGSCAALHSAVLHHHMPGLAECNTQPGQDNGGKRRGEDGECHCKASAQHSLRNTRRCVPCMGRIQALGLSFDRAALKYKQPALSTEQSIGAVMHRSSSTNGLLSTWCRLLVFQGCPVPSVVSVSAAWPSLVTPTTKSAPLPPTAYGQGRYCGGCVNQEGQQCSSPGGPAVPTSSINVQPASMTLDCQYCFTLPSLSTASYC